MNDFEQRKADFDSDWKQMKVAAIIMSAIYLIIIIGILFFCGWVTVSILQFLGIV